MKRYLTLLTIILAGETIFLLPFVVARVFRPTMLAAFEINNTQLGVLFSIYGLVATVAYFFGGILADRFPARYLIFTALVTSGLGGIITYLYPTFSVLKWVYGFYGLTTILPMWAAMLKAVRAWGGSKLQGKAFGFFEGGRGLVAALMGSATVALLSLLFPEFEGTLDQSVRQQAFLQLLLIISGFYFVVALLILIVLKGYKTQKEPLDQFKISQLKTVLNRRDVWLQAIIVLCGYVGYKVTDDISLYAYEVLDMNDIEAGKLGTTTLYLRAIGAVLAGILADRFLSSKVIFYSFIAGFAISLLVTLNLIAHQPAIVHIVTLLSIAFCVYGIRGIYFTLMEQTNIPQKVTGTAIGIISVIGMSPDIFMGPIMGYYLDNFPPSVSHNYVIGLLTIAFAIGAIATFSLTRLTPVKPLV